MDTVITSLKTGMLQGSRLDNYKAPTVKSSGAADVVSPPQSEPKPVKSAEVSTASVEQARYEVVQQASENLRNYFAISDTRFTIFKDAKGQYITRFTSLRDGSVSYFPEPELLKTYAKVAGSGESILKTSV